MDMISTQNMVKFIFRVYEMMENENGDAVEYRKQAPGSAVIRVSAENGDIKIPGGMLRKALWKKQLQKQNTVDEEE